MALQDKANQVVTDYNACLAAAGTKAQTTAALNTAQTAYAAALAAFEANHSNANAQAFAQAAATLNTAETEDTAASQAFATAIATLVASKATFNAGTAPFA